MNMDIAKMSLPHRNLLTIGVSDQRCGSASSHDTGLCTNQVAGFASVQHYPLAKDRARLAGDSHRRGDAHALLAPIVELEKSHCRVLRFRLHFNHLGSRLDETDALAYQILSGHCDSYRDSARHRGLRRRRFSWLTSISPSWTDMATLQIPSRMDVRTVPVISHVCVYPGVYTDVKRPPTSDIRVLLAICVKKIQRR